LLEVVDDEIQSFGQSGISSPVREDWERMVMGAIEELRYWQMTMTTVQPQARSGWSRITFSRR
jgi:hypothetical protein